MDVLSSRQPPCYREGLSPLVPKCSILLCFHGTPQSSVVARNHSESTRSHSHVRHSSLNSSNSAPCDTSHRHNARLEQGSHALDVDV
eukprot:698704-Amphidinium_carterae.1